MEVLVVYTLYGECHDKELTVCFEHSQTPIEEVKKTIPQIHTRAMQKSMLQKFGLISSGVKASTLRYFYRQLSGDV